MNQGAFTLRTIHDETHRPVVLDGGEIPSAVAVSWDCDVRRLVAHPWTFVASHDVDGARSGPIRSRTPVRSGTPVVSHAADRLARVIVLATSATNDPRTLAAWSACVGVSRGALRIWCNAAGVSARSCLDFLRVLRAVVRSNAHAWDLFSVLDVVDQRSLTHLLERGGVRELCYAKRPTRREYLDTQRFIENDQLLDAIARRMTSVDAGPDEWP